MKVIAIIGARPQFIKHYPLASNDSKQFDLITIHTGQHYDENMSKVFFDQLGMKKPDYLLSLGGGYHGTQTGNMMIALEKIVLQEKPEAIIVYGDTNSTLAGALVASKLQIPTIHIEAGLRSYNQQMPEEINRVLTDHISKLLLVPSQKSSDNLKLEGITKGVHIVGDIMKDVVLSSINNKLIGHNPQDKKYFYVTLHRPYNVDQSERLAYVLTSLNKLNKKVIFAAHPRTQERIKNFGLDKLINANIEVIEPQPYFQNLTYLHHSEGLITDSGGMQKEAYWLRKKCITIRSETEWTETLQGGANQLVFEDLGNIQNLFNSEATFNDDLYGDGNTATRIIKLIHTIKNNE